MSASHALVIGASPDGGIYFAAGPVTDELRFLDLRSVKLDRPHLPKEPRPFAYPNSLVPAYTGSARVMKLIHVICDSGRKPPDGLIH